MGFDYSAFRIMKYTIVVYLDSDYKKNAVIIYNTNKPMIEINDEGRLTLNKIIDKKYPGWYSYDIFKFENQQLRKKD